MIRSADESDSLWGAKKARFCFRYFLLNGWEGKTPAELSILVHEMVHHLQNVGQLKFACPEEREELAYKAQESWLHLFGHDLEHDFQMDPFTILVKSKCF
jgi:hypothetical protein